MRDFADALQYARQRDILEVTSLTHGRSLDTPLIEKIVRAQPNWISFSIDGMEEAYDSIRSSIPGEQDRTPFAVVFENLKKMVAIRDGLGLKLPQIRTNTIYPAIANDPELVRLRLKPLTRFNTNVTGRAAFIKIYFGISCECSTAAVLSVEAAADKTRDEFREALPALLGKLKLQAMGFRRMDCDSHLQMRIQNLPGASRP